MALLLVHETTMKGGSIALCLTLAIISYTFNVVTAILPQCQKSKFNTYYYTNS